MKFKNIAYLFGLLSFVLFGSSFSLLDSTKSSTDNILDKVGNKHFAEFLSKFEKTELPYAISLDELNSFTHIDPFATEYKTKKSIKNKTSFAKFLPALESRRFSRISPPKYTPINRFYVSEDVIAVTFKTKQNFFPGDFCGISIMLYDLKGNILSEANPSYRTRSMSIGGHDPKHSMSFSIDKNGILTTTTFVPTWEKDIKEFGYANNTVSKFTLSGVKTYKIEQSGLIKEIPTPQDNDQELIAKKDRC